MSVNVQQMDKFVKQKKKIQKRPPFRTALMAIYC